MPPEPITPTQLAELVDELAFLRRLVDLMISDRGLSWQAVLVQARRYESPLPRPSWRITYIGQLQEAVAAEKDGKKPEWVLSALPPIGDE